MTRYQRSVYLLATIAGTIALASSASAIAYEAPSPSEKLRPEITHLKISPSSFYAAPTGASISKTRTNARRRYGTTISYYDSRAATTILGLPGSDGCEKPHKGRACLPISKTLGYFFHSDKAGLNTIHFNGWIGRTARRRKRRLPPGTYRLVVLPRNTAGSGRQVSADFTIKG